MQECVFTRPAGEGRLSRNRGVRRNGEPAERLAVRAGLRDLGRQHIKSCTTFVWRLQIYKPYAFQMNFARAWRIMIISDASKARCSPQNSGTDHYRPATQDRSREAQ